MSTKTKQKTEWYDRTNDIYDWMEANPYSRFHWRDLLIDWYAIAEYYWSLNG